MNQDSLMLDESALRRGEYVLGIQQWYGFRVIAWWGIVDVDAADDVELAQLCEDRGIAAPMEEDAEEIRARVREWCRDQYRRLLARSYETERVMEEVFADLADLRRARGQVIRGPEQRLVGVDRVFWCLVIALVASLAAPLLAAIIAALTGVR